MPAIPQATAACPRADVEGTEDAATALETRNQGPVLRPRTPSLVSASKAACVVACDVGGDDDAQAGESRAAAPAHTMSPLGSNRDAEEEEGGSGGDRGQDATLGGSIYVNAQGVHHSDEHDGGDGQMAPQGDTDTGEVLKLPEARAASLVCPPDGRSRLASILLEQASVGPATANCAKRFALASRGCSPARLAALDHSRRLSPRRRGREQWPRSQSAEV